MQISLSVELGTPSIYLEVAMESGAVRDLLRGVCEMTPIEVAELQALKAKVFAKYPNREEAKKKFQWYAKLLIAGIPEPYWHLELEHFANDRDPKSKALVKKYCGMLDKALNEGMGLLFIGKHGCGKTMLSCIIGKEALRQGYTVKYIEIPKVLDAIMAGFGDKEVKERFNTIVTRTEFLILDDWGKEYQGIGEKLNPLVRLEFDRILRERVNKRRVTIGSTNYERKVVEMTYGPSVWSIVMGYVTLVDVAPGDYRHGLGDMFRKQLME